MSTPPHHRIALFLTILALLAASCSYGTSVESAESTALYWADRNGSIADPVLEVLPDLDTSDESTIELRRYDGDAPVLLYTVVGGGHTEPSITERLPASQTSFFGTQNADLETTSVIWEFFSSI